MQGGNTLRPKLHRPFQHFSSQPGICHPAVLCPVSPEEVSVALGLGSEQVSSSLEPADFRILQCAPRRGLAGTQLILGVGE